MPTLALLANPESGAGGSERVAELLAADGAVVGTFAISDWRDAASAGADRIVVAGGDGSLGCAAEAAARAGVPLAVVPTGTANDFARRRDLPSDLGEACALAAGGSRTIPLELAHAGSRSFLNVASAGLSPTAAEEAEDLKDRLGALAYPAGAAKAGATAEPVAIAIRCDGDLLYAGDAWQVSVASSGAFGGGAELVADQMDGLLDVVVIEGSGRARLLKRALGMTTRSLEGQDGVRTARCRSTELRIDGDETLNVDGEVVPAAELAEGGIVRFTVRAAAFELVVP
jgi:diacylglycerol kinase family enzyme